jgi:hypothetical protein
MGCDDCASSTSSATECSSYWPAAPIICVVRSARWQHYARSLPALEKEGIKWRKILFAMAGYRQKSPP